MNMKKRILSAIMTLAILASVISTTVFAGADPTITVSSPTITVGTSSVDVTISLSNNPGLVSMLIGVGYDSDVLTLTKVTDAGVLGNQSHSNDLSLNPYLLYWNNGTATTNFTPNGTVVTLTFDVAASATPNDYPITVTYDKDNDAIFNVDFEPVDFAIENGKVTVQDKPKQNITGITFADKTFNYDGTEKSITVSGSLPTGAKVDYTDNKGKNAGTYNATATVKCDGYNDLTLDAKMTINKKALTVTGLTAQNKTYDATKNAIISGGSLSGVVSGDTVSAVFPTSGTFAKADVGTGIAVSISNITLNGANADNYTLTQPTGLKANITAAPISVKADDVTIVKGSTVPALTYTITSGKLFGSDSLSGVLATTANGSKLGSFDITQGTLKATSNYNLTFTKGTLSVVDKTPQNITVSTITEKTYGDKSFKVVVTPDTTSGLNNFTYTSSNTNVAEIASDGTITIKNAGETNITVKQDGNATYAPFEKTQKLVVKKIAITITADNKTKRVGTTDPELTYTYTGSLAGTDKFVGSLTRQSGDTVGKYDILIGTLAINNNYDIIYNKAVFEITDKTPQNISIDTLEAKTYGDATFKINVTPDSISGLNDFTYESDNTDVAEIAADGTITIKSAGEANITVKQAGNDEYAAFENTQKLVVNKKPITLASINLNEKTAELVGILDSDAEKVVIDFDKTNIVPIEEIDEENIKATVTNLVLTGDKSANYALTTESIESTVKTGDIVAVDVVAENGTVTGAGKYLKGANVTLTATANSGYNFSGWYVEDAVVSTNTTYSFVADSDITLTAKFKKRSSGGGGSSTSSSYTIKLDTNGGNELKNISVKKNQTIGTIETPTKEGFIFNGWYSDKECTKEYDQDTKVTSSTTLYAGWKVDPVRQLILTIGKKEATVWNESKLNDVAPVIRNDRTMLPARFVAENLGATVEWDETGNGIVTITKDDVKIVIYIGEENAVVNGETVKLDSPAFIENDRTYTPIRFISENLGATVDWDEETKEVIITKKLDVKEGTN